MSEPANMNQANLAKLRIERGEDPAPGHRGLLRAAALLALLSVLGAAGWAAWDRFLKPAPLVRVFRVPSSAAGAAGRTLDASGYLVPQRRAEVATKVAGVVARVFVEEGDEVRAGQELAVLASESEAAQLEEAKVLLEEAEALNAEAGKGLAEAAARAEEAGRALEEAAARAKEAGKARDEAAALAEEARRDWERKRKLHQSGDIGDAELQTAESSVKALEARLAASGSAAEALESRRLGAEAGAKAAVARREGAESAAAAADARWRAAQSRLKQAEIRLADMAIRSPIAGRVTARKIHPGEAASPAGIVTGTRGGALFTVADFSTLEAEVDVGEARLSELREKHPARVAVDAVPGKKYRGELRQVVPMADRTRAVVKVRVRILDPDARLLPDMGLRVTFVAEDAPAEEARGPNVPKSAVTLADGHEVVWVVQDGRASKRAVTTGKAADGNVEVTSGLSGGEAVIVKNAVPLQEGMRVREEK